MPSRVPRTTSTLLLVLVTGCCAATSCWRDADAEDDAVIGDATVAEPGSDTDIAGPGVTDISQPESYFPPLEGDEWETVTPAELDDLFGSPSVSSHDGKRFFTQPLDRATRDSQRILAHAGSDNNIGRHFWP